MTDVLRTSWLAAFGLLLGAQAGAAATYPVTAGAAAGAPALKSDEYGRRAGTRSAAGAAKAPRPAGTSPVWTSLGPPGGDVSAVAASPADADIVLAGIAPNGSGGGTLYRSEDGGANWSAVADFAGTSVFDIAFARDGTAYAATQDSLWKSGDGGASWTRLELGLGLNDTIDGVTIDPGDDSHLWACGAAAAGLQTQTVLSSSDGGATWEDRTPPGHNAQYNCRAIAIDPADPDTLVAGFGGDFGGGEVWTSTDGGATWNDASAGLPGNPVNAVAFAGSRVLVGGGLLLGSQFLGLFASDDLGQTWTELDDGTWPLAVVDGLAVDPDDPLTILAGTGGAGLNRSTDGGATWETGVQGTAGLTVNAVRYAPGGANVFLGATSLAVFASSDGGASFAQAANGISELTLYGIATNPANPEEIAVAFQGLNSGGVFDSTDRGATWTAQDLPATRYSAVAFGPDGTLYALSSGPTTVAQEGLYRRNADSSWTNLGPDQGPYFESDLDVIRFGAAGPDLILLGGADFGAVGFGDTVWRSTDAGASWTKVYDGDPGGSSSQKVSDIQVLGGSGDQRIVASYDGFGAAQAGGVIVSADGGTTWNDSNAGLPAVARIPRLCQSGGDSPTLYLSAATSSSLTSAGVFRSDDGGDTWSAGSVDSSLIADIACDPADADTTYIARQDNSNYVMRSTDGGATYQPYAEGLAGAGGPTELIATTYDGSTQLLLSTLKGSFLLGPSDDRIFADGFDPR